MDNSFYYESVEEIKEALINNDTVLAVAKIQELLDNKNNIPLNVAITGESGSGKSTFVNIFRGIDNSDEGTTTMDMTPYCHPKYPNVTLWDLPGVGTTKFPVDEYLKHVGFEKSDFFIIISDTRFRENDVKLAQEIQKMRKKFYFVRSKIDNDLRAEKRSQREFNAEETLARIRTDCIQGLQNQGVDSPQVFLVSSFEHHLHEFSLLKETLERELPELKKDALLLNMININQQIINKKKSALQAPIKYIAALSAAVAAVPVPGLSAAADVALLVGFVTRYIHVFGLPQNYWQLVSKCVSTATLIAAEELSRCIPIFGKPAFMTLSFITTYRALSATLSVFTDDGQRTFKEALGLNTSV